ncbi:MAG: CcmD family protein [Chloroflexi bacterium]|nr:CcmD family protein [Chloroflexota bacterium]
MDDLDYLYTAFAIVWAVIFGYLLFLSRKQRQLRREIRELDERAEDRER